MSYTLTTRLSPNFTKGRGGNRVQYIVIHHWDDPAKKPLFDGAVATLVNPKRGASAHYVVEAGRVTRLVDEANTAWHCGNFRRNQQSIGIECNPRASEEDKKTIGELINDIQSRWGQLIIIGHKDVTSTSCPGRYYPPATVLKPYIKKGSASPAPQKPAQAPATPATPSGDIEQLARDVLAGKYGNGDARKKALGSKYSAVQARVNEILSGTSKPAQAPATPATPSGDIDKLARDVIAGKYGNGDARKKALGSKYSAVQARVNEILSGTSKPAPKPAAPAKKSNNDIAREVIRGDWGNGEDRRRRLTSAGYNYATIQSLVNQMLK